MREKGHNTKWVFFGLQVKPPWLKIIRSGAVWAIIVAHTSFSWDYSWILAYLPMYMEDVLHYEIAQVNNGDPPRSRPDNIMTFAVDLALKAN